MSGGRHKDGNWALPTAENGKIEKWEYVAIAVLMDIRDELKQLNALLHCSNFVGIPRTLKAIQRKIPTPKKRAPK